MIEPSTTIAPRVLRPTEPARRTTPDPATDQQAGDRLHPAPAGQPGTVAPADRWWRSHSGPGARRRRPAGAQSAPITRRIARAIGKRTPCFAGGTDFRAQPRLKLGALKPSVDERIRSVAHARSFDRRPESGRRCLAGAHPTFDPRDMHDQRRSGFNHSQCHVYGRWRHDQRDLRPVRGRDVNGRRL